MNYKDFKEKINQTVADATGASKKMYPNVDISVVKSEDTKFYGVILDAILKYLSVEANRDAKITLSNLWTDGKTAKIQISQTGAKPQKDLKSYLLGDTFKKDYGAKDLGSNTVQMLVTKETTTDGNSTAETNKEDDAKLRSSIFGKLKPFVDVTTKQVGSKLGGFTTMGEGYLKEEINRIKKLMK